ncbi:MAG: VCBS repeat-containing protein [Pyrinomonadaceae bacterium]
MSDFGQKTPKKRPGAAKAPVLPAPLPYDFSDKSGSLSAANRFFSAGSSLADYVSAPELPEGFENASPESPLSRDLAGVLRGASERILGSPAKAATNAAGDPSYDFDGDGKADMSVWNPSSSEWSVSQSNGQGTVSEVLGTSSSAPVPGDYDGDSKTDMAVFASGAWLAKPSAGGADLTHSFGTAGDVPVPGDYDGGGKTDWAVFRPSTSTWWVQSRETGAITSTAFGAAGDIPVQGNFDGDSKTDLAVFRPSTGDWHVLGTTAGYYAFHWGVATDTPVPADYDGDGKTDFAVFRPSTGTWYAHHSDGSGYTAFAWGNFGDQPAPADFDGDSKADFAVWRPTTGVWFVRKSATNAYAYESLGMNGDVPAQAAYVRKVGGFYAEYDFAKDRLSPKNATGGTDLYSGNVSWGAGLAGLPGRAGMSAGIGISYNSLVWTKDTKNSVMVFDADASNVSPGFTLGFGAIEPVYWDKANGRFAYLMTTPSGARVEFRQIGATNAYETKDSSYALLETFGNSNPNDPVEDITIAVTSAGGTKTEYEWNSGAFRPSKTTDRNGNFVSVSHNQYGLLESFTDTLGRVVNVNYDSALRPVSVTQQWRDQNGSGSPVTRTYAEFEYSQTAVDPSFDQSLGVFGPDGGTLLTVLSKVTYGTSSSNTGSTSFEYNSFGQVSKITNRAGDGHILSYSRTNLETPGTGLMDVPKLSETRNWTENFNLDQNGSEQETVFRNTIATGAAIPAAGGGGTGTKIEAWMEGHPTSNRSVSYVGGSGWMESLPILSEDWADDGGGLERKRWSATQWTQDDTNLSRPDNPRATVSRIGDDDNGYVRRTETTYRLYPNSTVSEYGLVEKTELFDESSPSVVLKRAETDYNLSAAYVSKRIIGLVSEARAYGLENGNLELASRTTFEYDHEGFTEETNQTVSPSAGHDNANYGASFVAGRGNQTSATRWDADDSQNQTKAITTVARYDTAGNAVASIDPMGRKVRIEYSDSFNDSSNPGTYAYPTKVFDPAGNFSRVKYRFDTGANVWADSPHPSDANDRGKETEREYDGFGRILRETLLNNGAYTRYEYPSAAVESRVYTTVVDMNGDGPDASDEVLSRAWTDGAGRTLETRTLHPGSTGGYAGSIAEYNEIGELVRSTVPTEVDSSGNPAGDDYRGAGVWLWNQREYDWKGRVTREINTDGTDRLISYEGCGCAGGQVTTVQGELVPRDDQPLVNARRTQKVYSDILGRNYKTEVFKWDGSTVYSRTEQTYDRRDAATKTRQTAVSETGQPYQDVDMTYDGFGRMKTRHYPIEDAGTYTEWFYNADGSNSQIIDPRGVITGFTYNDPRGLLTKLSYQVPSGSGIPDTPDVDISYDNLGNRILVSDETGSRSIAYNDISQITSETRTFAGLSGSYSLQYQYHLFGGLKKMDMLPNSTSVEYAYDKTGRPKAIAGTGFQDSGSNTAVGTILENIDYRAWDGPKMIELGNQKDTEIGYNDRLGVETFEISGFIDKQYEYYNDRRVRLSDDLLDDKFDRSYEFDNVGALVTAKSGDEATGGSTMTGPYKTEIAHDSFGNITARTMTHWDTSHLFSFQGSFANNRHTATTYDAAGNPTAFENHSAQYDSAGNAVKTVQPVDEEGNGSCLQTEVEDFRKYGADGSASVTKREQKLVCVNSQGGRTIQDQLDTNRYELVSSVTGMVVYVKSESVHTTPSGSTTTPGSDTRIYLGDRLVANMREQTGSTPYWFRWHHIDPNGATFAESTPAGSAFKMAEMDPTGASMGTENPYQNQPTPMYLESWGEMASPEMPATVMVDGVETPLSAFPGMLAIVVGCPDNKCMKATEEGFEFFKAFADGYAGYLNIHETYLGNGEIGIPSLKNNTEKTEVVVLDDDGTVFDSWGNSESSSYYSTGQIDRFETRFYYSGSKRDSFPCAPTGKELRNNKSIRKQLVKLLKEDSGHRTSDPLENGGWIYQRKDGVFFFEPVSQKGRLPYRIDLSTPPRIKNARVIAWVHTHPYPGSVQDLINNTEGSGKIYNLPADTLASPEMPERATGPSKADALNSKIPHLVVFEAADFGKGSTGYIVIASVGPERVDNMGCRKK